MADFDPQEYLDTLKRQTAAAEKAAALSEAEIEEKRRYRIALERHTTIVRDVVVRYADLAELITEQMAANQEIRQASQELTSKVQNLVEIMAQHSLNATAMHEWSEGFQRQIDDIRGILLLILGDQDKSRAIKKLKYE